MRPFSLQSLRRAPQTAAESDLPPPLYRGGVRLHDWKHTARSGMSIDFGIRDAGPKDIHPFKGLICGKENGQRMRVWIGPNSDVFTILEDTPGAYYKGEAILMRWSDDSVGGMSIRLLIDGGPDGTAGKHPFEGFATGRKEGELLNFAAWAVGDDENFQDPGKTRRSTPFHALTAVRQSHILCRDATFVSWLARNEKNLLPEPCGIRPEVDPAEFAAMAVRTYLGIETRAVMNHESREGAIARTRWQELMRGYFISEEYRSR